MRSTKRPIRTAQPRGKIKNPEELGPDIASSMLRFRLYGRPKLGEGEVFDFGDLDHDGRPKEEFEREFDQRARNAQQPETPSKRRRRGT